MAPSSPVMPIRRAIRPQDMSLVLATDSRVYPTSSPLQLPTIQSWYQYHPELGFIYEHPITGEVVATCIAVALTKPGWEQLTSGQKAESELTVDLIYSNARDDVIGLHIYHVEREASWDPAWPKLGLLALDHISEVLGELQAQREPGKPSLSVCGFSGLAVSPTGINLFGGLYNCREKGFTCNEFVLRDAAGALKVVSDLSQDELQRMLQEGYQFVNRCKMLVLTPDEPSIVWAKLSGYVQRTA
mmetsp:Transcript_21143/g.53741  ORF Transcript_21143/g.53741 Transcript_21143/m.53741 type:complete len:244 (-) Transcript_21143:129-860(-)